MNLELCTMFYKKWRMEQELEKNTNVIQLDQLKLELCTMFYDVPDLNAEESNSPTQCDPIGPPSSTPQSKTPSSNRTKRARTETIEALKEFSTKIGKISEVMEAATEHIGRLANCFQHESDSADRRMKLITEIWKAYLLVRYFWHQRNLLLILLRLTSFSAYQKTLNMLMSKDFYFRTSNILM
ncbi:hypothetical protein BVRB_6g156130 [Beta vulgaris subsp. vulgaris]|uniref:Uncharacterized protein n=1 Tax=Beta vulgaris subsp. vulgaris TaxID=3555 RepID=A0A0J8B7T5_BETVV|nr:hypothetical protein BVRB_6g156130 [Beta vulgaris subsp. vulgaris]